MVETAMALEISGAPIDPKSYLQLRRKYFFFGAFCTVLFIFLFSFDIHADDWLENRMKAAEQGDAAAQFHLGFMYDIGDGVPEDNITAIHWYQKAAEQGEVRAQVNLGSMYAHGDGVLKDDMAAFNWYQKAAELGFAMAQYNVGLLYDFGRGVPEDKVLAVHWYQKSAKQGYFLAQRNLAAKLYNGEGIAEDIVRAYAWMSVAAELSNNSEIIDVKETIASSMTLDEITVAENLSIEFLKTIYTDRKAE